MRDRALIRLRQVDSALAKLEIGTYGVCERCGRQIDAERLEAVPFANLCFECKRQEEAEHQDDEARPVEESVVPPWYSFRDNRHEHIAFDGEDTWQALAKYGTTNSPQDVLDSVDFADAYIDADEDIGFVDEMDSLVDIRGDGVSDLEAVYPEPLNRPARKRVR